MKRRSVSLLSLFLPLALVAAPQRRPTKPASLTPTPSPVATTPPYSDAAFDLAVSQLPPHYRGNSIERLIAAITPPAKGEFESTSEYEKRVGQPVAGGIYAFPLEEGSHCFIKYNADAQAFDVTVYGDVGVSIGYKRDYKRQALVVKEVTLSRREYESTNAFGAKATVTAARYRTFALIPTAWTGGSMSKISLQAPVPVEQAPKVKADLRTLAILRCDGSRDAIASGTYMIDATISSPSEILKEYHYLRGDLVAFWVYGFEDGKIYSKTTP